MKKWPCLAMMSGPTPSAEAHAIVAAKNAAAARRGTKYPKPVVDGSVIRRNLMGLSFGRSQNLVQALVVKIGSPGPSALRRGGAELQRMGGGFVDIESFRVRPHRHDLIMIDARR